MRTITVFETAEELLDALAGEGEVTIPDSVGIHLFMGSEHSPSEISFSGKSEDTQKFKLGTSVSPDKVVKVLMSGVKLRIEFSGGAWDSE